MILILSGHLDMHQGIMILGSKMKRPVDSISRPVYLGSKNAVFQGL